MAKTIDGVIGFVKETTPATNYIQQINAGNATHDIAVKNGIKFFNGGTEIDWDGKQAVEVVIPTLADIVANPVVLKGVINKAEDIPSSPSSGDLYYIGTTGEYFGVACEAGDMAIYYKGTGEETGKWNVISGENQIEFVGTPDDSGWFTHGLDAYIYQVGDTTSDYENTKISYNPTSQTFTFTNVLDGRQTIASLEAVRQKSIDAYNRAVNYQNTLSEEVNNEETSSDYTADDINAETFSKSEEITNALFDLGLL